jgi:hypothetical protein
MSQATVRFYAELNDYLPAAERFVSIAFLFEGTPSVGEMIVAKGVPISEVDLVLRDGEPVPFTEGMRNGCRLAVYPVFESFDIATLQRGATGPLRTPKFVCDVHLGKLAGFLRMLGFDTLYRGDYGDAELVRISLDQRRALLSRDRRLLENPILVRKFAVRSEKPLEQLTEVLRRFDLAEAARPFTRCLKCNSALSRVEKSDVLARLPERVRLAYDEFFHCPGCDRVYWKGTHFERMSEAVERVLTEIGTAHPRG